MIFKNDYYTAGFVVGTIAGAIADLINFIITHILNIGKVGYADFASVLIFGKLSSTIGQILFAHLVQLFFSALTGSLFLFWIKRGTKQFLVFKGITFGLFIWFLAFTVAQLYKLQFLHKFDLETVIVNNIAAIIYGISLGILVRFLYKKSELK